MRIHRQTALLIAVLATGCARPDDARRYELRGQVTNIQSSRNEITLKHDAVPGFMEAMTMPFTVRDVKELKDRVPGDLVTATLVVSQGAAHVENIRKIGFAEIAAPATVPAASSGFELLKTGEQVPDQALVDQNGKRTRVSAFKGKALAITFIYTRCPIPTFCPMMDRHFATIQRSVTGNARLRGRVHLLSVSFDPAYDTPTILKAHARSLEANPAMWTFLTGDRDEVDRFAARFGISVARNDKDQRDITHNLRTAVVSPAGTLIKIHSGYDWRPDQVLADLTAAVGSTQ